jgi:hypothetical protein
LDQAMLTALSDSETVRHTHTHTLTHTDTHTQREREREIHRHRHTAVFVCPIVFLHLRYDKRP